MSAKLTRADLLTAAEYAAERDAIRRQVMLLKGRRRVAVGAHCTVHFECKETMRYQVLEMLRAENSWERPGAIEDELAAYDPIVPGPGQLSATIMFEYETAEERAVALPRLVGIDRHVWLEIGDAGRAPASFDAGQIDEAKVSSVQYVKWNLTEAQCAALAVDGTVVRLVIDHPAYAAQAVLGEESRREIAKDPA